MTEGQVARHTITVLLVVVLAAAAWSLSSVVLVAFAACLLGLALDGATDLCLRYTGWPRPIMLATVVVALMAIFGGSLWLFGHSLSDDFTGLAKALPDAIHRLRDRVQGYSWGQAVLDELGSLDFAAMGKSALPGLVGTVTSAIGGIASLILILMTGLYLAIQPDLYIGGFLRLIPARDRNSARRLFKDIGHALRHWFLGQLIAMACIGVLTGTTLAVLGVPSAAALGVIAGIAEFVPIIGPIASAIPAVLIASAADPMLGVYTAIAFFAIQQIENHVLMPFIQSEAADLPPALTLFAAVVFGSLFGLLGVLFATPLAVVLMVTVGFFSEDEAPARESTPRRRAAG